MDTTFSPPALAALAAFPHLQEQTSCALEQQSRRIAERLAHFIPRPALIAALDKQIGAASGGLVMLEGLLGSGTTSLLCHMAATRPYVFWLPEDDAGMGLEALCAQILALYNLPVPLVPPAAGRDATTLERLLAEASAHREDPLVVLIDRIPDAQAVATPPPFLTTIPAGVVIVMVGTSRTELPLPATARVPMTVEGAQLARDLEQAAIQLGCTANLAAPVAAHSHGSFLYVRLATGLLQAGIIGPGSLPKGLAALHQVWWGQLNDTERQLASVFAAAGELIDPALGATLAGLSEDEVQHWIGRWKPFLERVGERAMIYHSSTRSFIARSQGYIRAHEAYVALAYARSGGCYENLNPDTDGYLIRQLARNVALSDPLSRDGAVPVLASRAWVVARERHTGTMRAAACDLAWELRMAAEDGPTLRLVRNAALAGTLALQARTLSPDAPAETFAAALERGGMREGMLKRVREMLDQLPSGRDKALALRRLGEVCYALRMRAPAMRMLSEALDLEVQG